MMGDVVSINTQTKLDVPVGNVISGAIDAKLNEIIIVGFQEDGEFYFAASGAYGPDVLWALERAKHELINRTRLASEGEIG